MCIRDSHYSYSFIDVCDMCSCATEDVCTDTTSGNKCRQSVPRPNSPENCDNSAEL